MVFFTNQNIGRIYIIKIFLPGDTIIYKIGMCHSNRTIDRMMEILRSWFKQYRFVPYSELRLNREFVYAENLEKHIHQILDHKRFLPNKKVNGGTEMFTEIDEHRVIQYLKSCRDIEFREPMILSDQDYRNLGQLISP